MTPTEADADSAVRRRLTELSGAAGRAGLHQLVRRNLRGVWIRGELPAGGAVWATNHHSWWDFFVAASALRAGGRSDVGVLMDAENIGHRGFFGSVGAVGTDRIRTAIGMLVAGMVLVVFPEGELRVAGPLGPVQPGAGWLAAKAGVPKLVVATRVLLRGQQAAEAYLDIESDESVTLEAKLAVLDRELAESDPDLPLPGFTELITGVRSWQERFGGRLTGP